MPTGCGYYDGEALGGVHMMVNRLNEVSVEEKERVETGPGVVDVKLTHMSGAQMIEPGRQRGHNIGV